MTSTNALPDSFRPGRADYNFPRYLVAVATFLADNVTMDCCLFLFLGEFHIAMRALPMIDKLCFLLAYFAVIEYRKISTLDVSRRLHAASRHGFAAVISFV